MLFLIHVLHIKANFACIWSTSLSICMRKTCAYEQAFTVRITLYKKKDKLKDISDLKFLVHLLNQIYD